MYCAYIDSVGYKDAWSLERGAGEGGWGWGWSKHTGHIQHTATLAILSLSLSHV